MGMGMNAPLVTTAHEKELVAGAMKLAGDEAAWLEALADYDQSGEWGEHGFFACSTWLAAACGIARITAREKLRVARCLRRLRHIHAAFRAGRISYSAVRAITRIDDMTDELEEALLDVALWGTVEDLEYLVKVWRDHRDQDRASASLRRQERKRTTRGVHVGDVFKLDSTLPLDEGEPLLNAILDAAGDLPRSTPLGERLTEGLVTLADHWHATRTDDPALALPGLSVAVDVEALAGKRHWATLAGRPIPAETARRLACDAKVSRVLTDSRSEPLDVGRATRVVPAGMRRALEARDGGCTFPGCRSRRRLDAHHVIHWVFDGETAMWNLVLLCRRHHRIVHEGEWDLVMTDAGPRFVDPLGRHHEPERLDQWKGPARAVA